MTATTPINGLQYYLPGDPADIAAATKGLAEGADTRLVPRFTTNAARDAAITVPVAGQICVITPAGELPQAQIYGGGGWQERIFREQRASGALGVAHDTWTLMNGWTNDTALAVGQGITSDVGGYLLAPGVYEIDAMFTWTGGTAAPRMLMGLGFSQTAPPDPYRQGGSSASSAIQYTSYSTKFRITAAGTRVSMFAYQDSGASRSINVRRFAISRSVL